MTLHITENRDGFASGQTTITRYDEEEDNTGIALAVMKLAAGKSITLDAECETAWLLMCGNVHGRAGGQEFAFERTSLFDESSSCIHVSANTAVDMHCTADTEFTVYRCDNSREFETRIYRPEDVANEPRGKGQVNDRCLRYVRTIFDGTNAPAEAELVLGEVVTFQGGWSSYPPHHHPQPEIYHYRFTEPQGYGHAELGEAVLKVRNYDTVKILDEKDHAQCTAPGYGMYYSWVIRHLPGNPYTVPDFTEEHAWVMSPEQSFWDPDTK